MDQKKKKKLKELSILQREGRKAEEGTWEG